MGVRARTLTSSFFTLQVKVSSAFDTDMYSYTLVWARCRETPHSEEMYSNAPEMYSSTPEPFKDGMASQGIKRVPIIPGRPYGNLSERYNQSFQNVAWKKTNAYQY